MIIVLVTCGGRRLPSSISPAALSLVKERWPFLPFADKRAPPSNWSIRTLRTYKTSHSDIVDNAASDDKTQNHDPYVGKCCETYLCDESKYLMRLQPKYGLIDSRRRPRWLGPIDADRLLFSWIIRFSVHPQAPRLHIRWVCVGISIYIFMDVFGWKFCGGMA